MRDFYATVEWLQHFLINLYVHLLLQFHFCSTQNLKFYYMKLLLFLLFYLFIFFAAFKHPIDAKAKNSPLTSSYSDIALDYQTRPVSVEKLFILRGLTSSWQYWCYERVFSSSKSCLFELLININAVWISYRMHDCQLLCIIYLEFLFLYRMPTMNHTVFSGIIQMRTYDLVFVVPKKFIIKSRADLIHDVAKMRSLSSRVVFFYVCFIIVCLFFWRREEKFRISNL